MKNKHFHLISPPPPLDVLGSFPKINILLVSCPTQFGGGLTPFMVWAQLTLIAGNSVIHHHVVKYNSISY